MEDENTDTQGTTYDWTEGENPTVSIVHAIAAETDQDPTDLDSLDGRVDGDALNTLLETGDDSLSVSFRYDNQVVTVSGRGAITIRPL